jgi:SAM-dependent methyltransferase
MAPVVRRLPGGDRWHCPVCGHSGRFMTRSGLTGKRLSATCPTCRSSERDRVHYVLLREVIDQLPPRTRILEIAPSSRLQRLLRSPGVVYTSCDLRRSDVSLRCDATRLPFPDESFDLIVVSHVLEHIPDDRVAIAEIARVLARAGVAFVAVPVVGPTTVEYPSANPYEDFHVRAPGHDYYNRLLGAFNWFVPLDSHRVSARYQPFYREDRSKFPNSVAPHRLPEEGESHPECVAVAGHDRAVEERVATMTPATVRNTDTI